MNEHLFTNDHGLRLITEYEGAPRLKARLCEGGRYELGYGITFHLDGSPVLENQTCTEEQAMAMFRNALERFEAVVRAHVTVPLNSNQFSALTAFSYNVGEANFATSTVLRMTNQMRFEDAAAAFGMWVFATRNGYKQALRGLLRRRYAEACLYLSYDWTEACADEAVALQREKPATLPGADRVLYKTPFANILRVAQRYPLDDAQVAAHAQVAAPATYEPITADRAVDAAPDSAIASGIPVQLPIPEIEEDELLLEQPAASPVASPETAKGSPPVSPQPTSAAVPSVSESAPAKPSNSTQAPMSKPATGEVAAAPPSRSEVTPLPPKLPDPPIPIGQQTSAVDATRKSEDWSDSAKSMIYSRRFWGLSLVVVGRLWMLKTGSNAVLGAVSDPIVTEMFSGFMVMMIGEIVQHWGKQKATRPLK